MAYREFKRSEYEANNLYTQYRNQDPCLKIPPALLNSADIIKYVEETAMINPFFAGEDFLKPASYSLRISGKYKFWDSKEEDGGEIEGSLDKRGDFFILKRNTIAFITIESKLRLPHYIAARFNLQIRLVHRGILLGTGPLVDPGFEGQLVIPLHNLTNNDYRIEYLDPLIWMEFTKISNSIDFTSKMGEKSNSPFFAFKRASMNADLYDYLVKASPHKSIESSVSKLVEKGDKLQMKAEGIINKINIAVILSGITLAIGLGTFFYNTTVIRKDSLDYVNKSMEKFQIFEKKVDSISQKLNEANLEIKTLKESSNAH
jgi:deoxycytidine triphosphate deaminase